MKRYIFTALTFFLLCQAGFAQREVLDRVIAVVDESIILQSELDQMAANLALQSKIQPQPGLDEFEEIRKATLEQLIIQKVLLVRAKEDSVEVDPSRVDQVLEENIATMVRQIGSESKLEAYFGSSIRKLKKNFRKADLIAHFGQSEFVGLFTQTDQEGASIGVDRLRRIVEEHFTQSAQKPFRLTISVGLVEYNEHIVHKDQLIDNAAAALRNAQVRGGNRVEKFSRSAHKEKLIANITAALNSARESDLDEDESWLPSK